MQFIFALEILVESSAYVILTDEVLFPSAKLYCVLGESDLNKFLSNTRVLVKPAG